MAKASTKKKVYTLAQKRADPNKRKLLSMSQLTPVQQAQRTQRLRVAADDKNPLLNPAQQLAGSNLRSAANQITDAQYAPQEAQLGRDMANVTAQGTKLQSNAGDYYRQLATQEAGSAARQRQLGDMLSQRLGAIRVQSGQDADQLAAAEQSRQATDATQRGSGLGGGNGALDDLAALRTRANANQDTAERDAATQTSNWANYSGALAGARQLKGAEVQAQLGNRLLNSQADIAAKQNDLASNRGNSQMKNLVDLRQQSFENALTQGQLNVKSDQIDATLKGISQRAKTADLTSKRTAATSRANAKLSATTSATTARLNRQAANQRNSDSIASREKIAAEKQNASGGPKQKNEPASSIKYRQDIAAARGMWRRLMKDPRAKKNGGERWVKQTMIESKGVPPEAYNAVYDLERVGTIHPANVKALEALGVVVPPGWRRKNSGNRPISTSAIPANKR